ncbi:MAG: MFS transporter, partial [Gammaproteobacteria bacterium]
FLLVWGVAVVGDSPQFSAMNAATAPAAYVGSALTLVNCLGFALTVVSVQVLAASAAWLAPPWWFVPVAIGPALGLLALRRLVRAAGATPGRAA